MVVVQCTREPNGIRECDNIVFNNFAFWYCEDEGTLVLPGDRHRGGGHPPTPATPPCVRVRTRRFESVALTPIDQRRKSERFEVRIRKPY